MVKISKFYCMISVKKYVILDINACKNRRWTCSRLIQYLKATNSAICLATNLVNIYWYPTKTNSARDVPPIFCWISTPLSIIREWTDREKTQRFTLRRCKANTSFTIRHWKSFLVLYLQNHMWWWCSVWFLMIFKVIGNNKLYIL